MARTARPIAAADRSMCAAVVCQLAIDTRSIGRPAHRVPLAGTAVPATDRWRTPLGEVPIDWAQGGWLSIAMVVFADTWKVLPLMVLLCIAGLEAIPRSVHEASQVDGSPPLYKFFTVTLPLMKPYLTIALILRAIDAFRIFELPLILAGTATTPLITTVAYHEYTRQNYNLSSASGTILTGLILLFVLTYLSIMEREREPHA